MESNRLSLGVSERGALMICLQTLLEPLLYHSISLLYPHQVPLQWREPLCCVSMPSLRRTVNICHFHIYISCYYLLGLGLHPVSLRVLDFWPRELSIEEGSSHNHATAWQCFSFGCPIYQCPKWFQYCSIQWNEEYLITSIFIRMPCYPCLPLMFLL